MQEKVKARRNGKSEERGTRSSCTETPQARHDQPEHTITTSNIKQLVKCF